MIRNRKGSPLVVCDACSKEEQGEKMEFLEFLSYIQELGWSIRKNADGKWCHYCPDCK